MAPAGKSSPKLSSEHKAALVVGRAQAKVVRDYLSALKAQRPKPGRKRTIESVRKRLKAVEEALAASGLEDEDPVRMLVLLQERIDLTAELKEMDSRSDLGRLEKQFVKVAAEFGHRKGIGYEAWRKMGVSASTLRDARIKLGAA